MQELKCTNCGSTATLLPSGTQAFCEACGSKFVVNDLRNVNPNIADKANLVAALSYQATDEKLHARIVDFLTHCMEAHSVPCDILEEIRIVSLEKHAFSGFQFDCQYTATWTGEKTSKREVDDSYYDSNGHHSRTKTLESTTVVTGYVSGSPTLYGCAVKDVDPAVHKLFDGIESSQMHDVEFADFEGEDLVHHPFSLPLATVYGLHVPSRIGDLASQQADNTGASNCVVTQPDIRYDKVRTRIVVTAAKVDAEYKGIIFSFWISGDGLTIAADERMPEASSEKANYEQALSDRAKCAPPKFGWLMFWTILFIALPVAILVRNENCTLESILSRWFYITTLAAPISILEGNINIGLLLALLSPSYWIICLTLRNIYRAMNISGCDDAIRRLDAPYQSAIKAFHSKGRAIRGILAVGSNANLTKDK